MGLILINFVAPKLLDARKVMTRDKEKNQTRG